MGDRHFKEATFLPLWDELEDAAVVYIYRCTEREKSKEKWKKKELKKKVLCIFIYV